ncbi:aromatic ring-hydroxylating oxygenase subunit alpha [Nocardia takedensis]
MSTVEAAAPRGAANSSPAVLAAMREAVDWEAGLVAGSIHFDPAIYRLEADRIFNRAWLVVGHEDLLRKPGDYLTNYMGEVPVIVTRDRRNEINVVVNKCAHRGNQVCLHDRGNVKGFTCSYHGWSYGLDGRMTGAPMEQFFYRDELDKPALGLERVAQVAIFHGLIFATFDASAPTLEEWLGADTCWWLENYVLAAPLGGLEALPGAHRYHSPGNWKLVSENFIGDNYHVFSATHVAWLSLVQENLEKGSRHPMLTYPGTGTGANIPMWEVSTGGEGKAAPMGLGMVTIDDEQTFARDLAEAEQLGPDAVEWLHFRRRTYAELAKDLDGVPYGFMNGLIFPNFAFMGYFSPMVGRHFQTFHPRGPRDHECWQWALVERDAPQSIKDLATQRVYQGQHMAGIIAPDDVENFERMVDASAPERNWARPFHLRLQLGHEAEGLPTKLPGLVSPNPSEIDQRRFYRFWLQQMVEG